MDELCAMCKEMKEADVKLIRNRMPFMYELVLCYDCGNKIKSIILKEDD